MFTSIVVGTDGSPSAAAAVRRAAELAAGNDATLHIVSAYKRADMIGGVDPLAAATAAGASVVSEKELAELAAGVLERAAADARAGGATVEIHAVAGVPHDVLLEMADAYKADLIVVGNRGMRGARRFLGSVPNSVSHHATCSVLIVQTT